MLDEKQNRREFLESAVNLGAGVIATSLIPNFTRAYTTGSSTDFNRDYVFKGKLLVFGMSFDIEGNITFEIEDGQTYESRIECFNSWQNEPFYSIYSTCTLEEGILIPKKTITHKKIKYALIDTNKKTTLDYEQRGLVVLGKVERYDSEGNLTRTSYKYNKHKAIGLDRISSVLQLLLSARNGIIPKEISLISTNGKISRHKVVFEEYEKGYRISLKNKNKSLKSIVLELDGENELTYIHLARTHGDINANVRRVV